MVCMHADALNIAGVNTGSGPIQYTRGNCTVRKVGPHGCTCPGHVDLHHLGATALMLGELLCVMD